MSRKDKTFRILVLSEMHAKPDRCRLAGILRYALLHPQWEVEIFPEHPANRVLPPDPRHFDGLITTGFFLDTIREARELNTIRPAVVLDPSHDFRLEGRGAIIREDNHLVGQKAAEFFIRKGLRSFGYIGTPQPRHWSDERGEGFASRLAQNGFSAQIYRQTAKPVDGEQERSAIVKFLTALPKPCGVLAAFDERAKQVLNFCRAAGLAVPGQVGVLGVDNEEFICETSIPTLSSIEPELEESGYQAAELLDRILHGGRIPDVGTYGVKGIVERLSTADLSGKSRIVSIAEEFIRQNSNAPITPHDIAVACRCSLRLLQRSFAAVLGVSPAQRLRQQRLARVCDMLERTRTPINLIGGLCGLPNAKHLKTLFRRTYGMTMGDYRTHATRCSMRCG